MNNEYLYHHGILGQRWGVRRYQNKDGSYTNLGRERHADSESDNSTKERIYAVKREGKANIDKAKADYKQAKKEYNKKTLYGIGYNQKASEKVYRKQSKLRVEKKILEDNKAAIKANNKEKSKYRLELEEKYKKEGLTPKEAEIEAYKAERVRKALLVAGGVTVAAAAAYVAYRHYDRYVDKVIKAGTLMQNISNEANKGVREAIYTSKSALDNKKYAGIYGNDFRKAGQEVYKTGFKAAGDIKLASEKSSSRILNNLIKSNPEYKKDLIDHLTASKRAFSIQGNNKQFMALDKGVESLKKGKLDKSVYEALNVSLANHSSPSHSKAVQPFYEALRKEGYGAISDINDRRLSGYASKTANIIIDNKKLKTDSVEKLTNEVIDKNLKTGMLAINARANAPAAAVALGSYAAVKKMDKAATKSVDDRIVRKYRKEHPDSDLSYNEILRNYYK